MAASKENPTYTVYLVVGQNTYNITPVVTDISLSNQEKQLAQSATITALNIKTKSGKTICELVDVRQRIFIYANDGSKSDEVFRGWIWTFYHKTELDSDPITLKCYDNLIYLQESDDSLYFAKGKNTKSVIQSICTRWGIKLNYSYSTITHDKLVLKGSLSNIIVSDILELVQKRRGTRYAITSQKDVMYISTVGQNKTIYQIVRKQNAVETRYDKSMDDMVTKVSILGHADKDSEKVPVVATVKGNTSKYGTLQKLLTSSKDDALSDAKKEAKTMISEKGKPAEEFTVIAADVPWIRKGDKVHVKAGHIGGRDLIVYGIERSISNKKKTMELTLRAK